MPAPRPPRTTRSGERRRLRKTGREAARRSDPSSRGRSPRTRWGGRWSRHRQRGCWRASSAASSMACRRSEDRGKQEEAEPGREEQVADRCDVANERDRDRQDVAERAGMEQEIRGERVVAEQPVERRKDGVGSEACRDEARLPDRHVAAVGEDRDRIQEDPDEGQAQSGLGAVGPQPGEQEAERHGEEGQSGGVDDLEARLDRPLRYEADDHRQEQETRPSAAGRGRGCRCCRRPGGRRSGRGGFLRSASASQPAVDAAEPVTRTSDRLAWPMWSGPGSSRSDPFDGRRIRARCRLCQPICRLGDERDLPRLDAATWVADAIDPRRPRECVNDAGSNWIPANLRSSAAPAPASAVSSGTAAARSSPRMRRRRGESAPTSGSRRRSADPDTPTR